MHVKPAGPGGLDQVRTGQQVKHAASPVGRRLGQRGRGVAVEIGAGMQAQQPERPAFIDVQDPVRPGEYGPHRGAGVPAGIEEVQSPLLISQLSDQIGERCGGAGDGELGGHPQCQRQPAALGGQGRGRAGIGIDSRADQGPEQGYRLSSRQQV
jgi:hypothetical protein